MRKITKLEFEEMKKDSIDIFDFPKGNFWIIHSKTDGKFYPVRHCRSQYWSAPPTKYFTEVLRALWNCDKMEWENPASQKIFY